VGLPSEGFGAGWPVDESHHYGAVTAGCQCFPLSRTAGKLPDVLHAAGSRPMEGNYEPARIRRRSDNYAAIGTSAVRSAVVDARAHSSVDVPEELVVACLRPPEGLVSPDHAFSRSTDDDATIGGSAVRSTSLCRRVRERPEIGQVEVRPAPHRNVELA